MLLKHKANSKVAATKRTTTKYRRLDVSSYLRLVVEPWPAYPACKEAREVLVLSLPRAIVSLVSSARLQIDKHGLPAILRALYRTCSKGVLFPFIASSSSIAMEHTAISRSPSLLQCMFKRSVISLYCLFLTDYPSITWQLITQTKGNSIPRCNLVATRDYSWNPQ
jgi:hypothetical protein